jgi:hypothetical protein
MLSQLYHFTIPGDSMVIMNYSNYVHIGTPISGDIFEATPAGAVYDTGLASLGSSYIGLGYASSNLDNALYMTAGDYMLYLSTASATNGPSANFEINTYPISNFTSGSLLSIGVGGISAFVINTPSAFHFDAFNVTLTSHLNASMTYAMDVFNNQNLRVSGYVGDGSNAGHAGIGNRETSGSWLGTSGSFSTYQGARWFSGNESSGIAQFVSTYAGKYYVLFSFTNGYNTTSTPWQYYKNLVAAVKIDLYSPSSFGPVAETRYASLDSSSGTGTTTITFTGGAVLNTRLIALALTPKVDTWTRVTVTITNGTVVGAANGTRGGGYEALYDTLRPFAMNTFDYDNSLSNFMPALTYCMVHGATTTYNIEFGAYAPQMMIAFYPEIDAASVGAHALVTITVNHFATPGVSGLLSTVVSSTGPVAPFPVAILIVIVVVVVVVIVAVIGFTMIRKRSR